MNPVKLRGKKAGCSWAVIETLPKARASTANHTHSRVWERFATIAEAQDFHPMSHQNHKYYIFLEMVLCMNTLRVQVSALSLLTGVKWVTYQLVCQFLRACARIHNPERLFVPPWNLQVVLDVLSQSPFLVDQSSSWNVILKAVFLIAMMSVRRLSDIQALGYKPLYYYECPRTVVCLNKFTLNSILTASRKRCVLL